MGLFITLILGLFILIGALISFFSEQNKKFINLLPSSIKCSKHMCLSALQIWKRLFFSSIHLPYLGASLGCPNSFFDSFGWFLRVVQIILYRGKELFGRVEKTIWTNEKCHLLRHCQFYIWYFFDIIEKTPISFWAISAHQTVWNIQDGIQTI